MKRILIIGASILQLPMIQKAKEMGLYVGVLDMDPNAVGIQFADEYFCVSTIDIPRAVQAAKEFRPDGVATLATDMPVRTIAAICEELGLYGVSKETAVKATDKIKMIQAFEAHDVAHPWYFAVENREAFEKIKDRVQFPCIIKPADNSGSRGVALNNNIEELEASYDYAASSSRGGAVMIEEYLVGPEVSVELIVTNGTAHILQVTDKLTTGAPHFVEMGHSQPSRLPAETLAQIKSLAAKAAAAVGIVDGAAHVEMIVTAEGPKMVELGARMGGDCITTHLVPLSTGIDMTACVINIAIGEKPDLEQKFEKGSAIRYLPQKEGTVTRIEGIREAAAMHGIQQVSIVHGEGASVHTVHSSGDRIGFVIAQDENAAAAVADCESAAALIRVTYDSER